MPFAGPYAIGSQEFINAVAGHNRGGPHVRDVATDPWTGGLTGIFTDPLGAPTTPVSGATNQSPLGGAQSGTSAVTGNPPVSGGVNLGAPESVTAKAIATTPGITPSLESVGDGTGAGAEGAPGGGGFGFSGLGSVFSGSSLGSAIGSAVSPGNVAGSTPAAQFGSNLGLSPTVANGIVSLAGMFGGPLGSIASLGNTAIGLSNAISASRGFSGPAVAGSRGFSAPSPSMSVVGRGSGGDDPDATADPDASSAAASSAAANPSGEVGPGTVSSDPTDPGDVASADASSAAAAGVAGAASAAAAGEAAGVASGTGESGDASAGGGGVAGDDGGGVGDSGGDSGGEGFATGGWVGGKGGTDSVDARLTPGEFVVQEDVAARYPWLMELLQTSSGREEHPWADSPYASLLDD